MNNEDLIRFSHSLHILFISCVDCDKEHALELFNIFFSNVDVVDTKEEALKSFHNSKYDLIISGLKIPEIDEGISFIEEIRSISKDITILTIASDLNQFQFTKLIGLNIDGFLIKPVYIKQFSDVIHKTLERLKNKEDIYHYRLDLENKVQEQVELLRKKDQTLLQQSKLAAMGEMMDAVAHQWAQPINTIKMKVDYLEYDYEDNLIDKEFIKSFKKQIFEQFDHMTNTLYEFRSFFRPNKKQEEFEVKSMIEKVLLLVKDEFMKNSITVTILEKQNFTLLGVENEFKHLILNIINNSKDAFIENSISNREIKITLSKQIDKNLIEIEDNAGGIPKDIIEDIFKANVTSKQDGKGTGIGLYMSAQIAQKYNGVLRADNVDNGVKFTFEVS